MRDHRINVNFLSGTQVDVIKTLLAAAVLKFKKMLWTSKADSFIHYMIEGAL